MRLIIPVLVLSIAAAAAETESALKQENNILRERLQERDAKIAFIGTLTQSTKEAIGREATATKTCWTTTRNGEDCVGNDAIPHRAYPPQASKQEPPSEGATKRSVSKQTNKYTKPTRTLLEHTTEGSDSLTKGSMIQRRLLGTVGKESGTCDGTNHAAKACLRVTGGKSTSTECTRVAGNPDFNSWPWSMCTKAEDILKTRTVRLLRDPRESSAWTTSSPFMSSGMSLVSCGNTHSCSALEKLMEGVNTHFQSQQAHSAAPSAGAIDLDLAKVLIHRDCHVTEVADAVSNCKCAGGASICDTCGESHIMATLKCYDVRKHCKLKFPDQDGQKVLVGGKVDLSNHGIAQECAVL